MQHVQCLLPPGSTAVRYMIAVPTSPGSVALHSSRSTAYGPHTMWQWRWSSTAYWPQAECGCITTASLPIVPIWWCNGGGPCPLPPQHCCSALKQLHCPLTPAVGRRSRALPYTLPRGSMAVHCAVLRHTALSCVAVHCSSSTAYCSRAVWRRIARCPQPTAHSQCVAILHYLPAHFLQAVWRCIVDFHCPLPTARKKCCPLRLWGTRSRPSPLIH